MQLVGLEGGNVVKAFPPSLFPTTYLNPLIRNIVSILFSPFLNPSTFSKQVLQAKLIWHI